MREAESPVPEFHRSPQLIKAEKMVELKPIKFMPHGKSNARKKIRELLVAQKTKISANRKSY